MEDMVNKIHDVVLADHRVKIREIADIVSISIERVQNILHKELGMKKPSARWVPRLLTVEQKRNRMTTSEQWRRQLYTRQGLGPAIFESALPWALPLGVAIPKKIKL